MDKPRAYVTRQKVILHQILFDKGSEFNSRILSENERLIRQQKYAADAKIRVLTKCGEEVGVEVMTKEVRTVVPGFSFHSSGGHGCLEFEIRDSNALGTGQRASAFYSSDTNRNS